MDEFYKASKAFDKERSPALIRSILRFGKIADQRYFLAPNISELGENAFTADMEFLRLDFNTVFLEKIELYSEIGKDEQKKSEVLLRILDSNVGKSLIYAGTYTNIKKVSNLLMDTYEPMDRKLLHQFQAWLATNYDPNWELTKLVVKGVGIHNGQLHRSLSQIQIKLFEEEYGLEQIISTSSIIEGVNTSAQNVILWSNKNGNARINDFTYKNIIGRGGRMFHHFIGRVFVLEQPPDEELTQLDLEFPDELLGTIGEDYPATEYTSDQVVKIQQYEFEMRSLMGPENLEYFRRNEVFQNSNSNLILGIARDIQQNPDSWDGLRYLNFDNSQSWNQILYKLIQLQPGAWDIQYGKYVGFVKILANNWRKTIPELLEELSLLDLGIDDFFKLERNTTFKLAALLSDVHTIYNRIIQSNPIDLTPAISKISHAFLPSVVFQLEEYGVPRMISRKINAAGIVNLEDHQVNIHDLIETFRGIGLDRLLRSVGDLDEFDAYILHYFYDGISHKNENLTTASS